MVPLGPLVLSHSFLRKEIPRAPRAGLAGVFALLPLILLAAQNRPNLSGDWVLVSATATGVRGGDEGVEVRISSNTASGAAFNCGRGCSLVQKGARLTIDKALLGSDTDPAPSVTLPLDGRETSVVDSFNPGRQILVKAGWNEEKLEITTGRNAYTQVVYIEGADLVVLTSSGTAGGRVKFRYRRK